MRAGCTGYCILLDLLPKTMLKSTITNRLIMHFPSAYYYVLHLDCKCPGNLEETRGHTDVTPQASKSKKKAIPVTDRGGL
jgi:hypothetical protein